MVNFIEYPKNTSIFLDKFIIILDMSSTNIEEFEHMEYIHDKIISFTTFENLNIYIKTRVVHGIIG
jgi:hypothetical protein